MSRNSRKRRQKRRRRGILIAEIIILVLLALALIVVIRGTQLLGGCGAVYPACEGSEEFKGYGRRIQ